MHKSISVAGFRASSEEDREIVKTFMDSDPSTCLEHVCEIELAHGGVRVTRFMLDESGKRYVLAGREVARETTFVSCSLPNNVRNALSRMESRS